MISRNLVVLEIIIGIALFFITFGSSGCGNNTASAPSDDSPTAAYKRLFNAVKSKDIEAIKAELSKQSNALVVSISTMQKRPVEEVYGNGLTTTLKSETLPEIRDERIKGDSGAIEVYDSSAHKWTDIPYVHEDGRWKLALGDAFNGKFTFPDKGRDQKEKEAANALAEHTPLPVNLPVNAAPPAAANTTSNK